MRGGRRPGAGRPPGARNRKTIQTEEAILASGMTPLDYMINVMRNEDTDPRTRLEVAARAAPYTHAKLPATELTVNDREPVDVDAMAPTLDSGFQSAVEVLEAFGSGPSVIAFIFVPATTGPLAVVARRNHLLQ